MDKFETISHSAEELENISDKVLNGTYVNYLKSKVNEIKVDLKKFNDRINVQIQECDKVLNDVDKFQVKETERERIKATSGTKLKDMLKELNDFPVLEINDKFIALLREIDSVKVIIRNATTVPELGTNSYTKRPRTSQGGLKIEKKIQLIAVARKADEPEFESCTLSDSVRMLNENDVHRPESRNYNSSYGYNIPIPYSRSKEGNKKTNESRTETESQTEYSFKPDDNVEMIVRTYTSTDDEHQPVSTYSDELFDSDSSGEESEPSGDQVSGRTKKQSKPADASYSDNTDLTDMIKPIPPVSTEVTRSNGPAENRVVSNTTEGNTPNLPVYVPPNDKPDEKTETDTNVVTPVGTDEKTSMAPAAGTLKVASDMVISDSITPRVKLPEIVILGDGQLQIKTLVGLALFDTYVVIATDSKLIRLEKDSYVDMGRLVLGCYVIAMCKIRSSSDIGVLTHSDGIIVVSTDGSEMAVKYKLKTHKPFSKICHLTTYINEEPDPSYQFAVLLTTHSTLSSTGRIHDEKIGLIRAKPDRYDKRLPVPIYSVDYKELAISEHNVRSISGIGAFKRNRLLLSTPHEVVCLKIKNDMWSTMVNWELELRKNPTDIYCTKSQAYICIRDEGKVMMVDKNGRIQVENILEGKVSATPGQISVCGDTVLMKVFDYTNWTSNVRASQAL